MDDFPPTHEQKSLAKNVTNGIILDGIPTTYRQSLFHQKLFLPYFNKLNY